MDPIGWVEFGVLVVGGLVTAGAAALALGVYWLWQTIDKRLLP